LPSQKSDGGKNDNDVEVQQSKSQEEAAENRLKLKRKHRKVSRAFIDNEEIPFSQGKARSLSAKKKGEPKKYQGKDMVPNKSFTILDVLASLSTPVQVQPTVEESENKTGSKEDAEAHEPSIETLDENVGPAANFEWPQPIEYLPEKNLYNEFVWNPAPLSLAKEKEIKIKQKRKMAKTLQPQEASAAHVQKMASSPTRVTSKSPTPSRGRTKAKLMSPSRSTAPSVEAKSTSSTGRLSRQPSNVPDDNATKASTDSVTRKAEAIITAFVNGESSEEKSCTLRSVSSDDGDSAEITLGSIAGGAFPAMAMEAGDDDTAYGSITTNRSGATSTRTPKMEAAKSKIPTTNLYHLAESKSKFLGMEQDRSLMVLTNLDLYFKTFVFPDFVPDMDTDHLTDEDNTDTWQSIFFRFPRVQLYSKDRELREQARSKLPAKPLLNGEIDRETCLRVWKENVVACGKPSLRRLPPNRTAHFGFHGDLSWVDGKVNTVSECRHVILCLTDICIYIILDNDSFTSKVKASATAATTLADKASRSTGATLASSTSATAPYTPESKIFQSIAAKARKFPAPIPSDTRFSQALWPHAVACHPLRDITGITIGFGFQRLALRVRNNAYPSAVDFTYQLLTSNKLETVELVQELQQLVKDVKLLEVGQTSFIGSATDDFIKIDNDDKIFLDSLAAAVAPEPLGLVLHYQILKQRWNHGQRGAVRRVCVVTDAQIYLLDEGYVGDGAVSMDAMNGRRLGSPVFRLIDAAGLEHIAEVRAADADPNAITIVIRPNGKLLRTHRWRLLCRDRTGAEKLVEDVRKGMSMVE